MRILLLFISISLVNTSLLIAQTYTVNGNATQTNCRCYNLTTTFPSGQSGAVWNNFKISLNTSFDFNFDVYLGCGDGGADGIAFVMQPISTSVGGTGSGLGFGGISPSIGVTLDTYQNSSPDNDPFYDHIAIQRNGILDHSDLINNLAGPVPACASNNDVEDCVTHKLRVQWNATTKTLTTYFDNVLRLSIVNDLVNSTFLGNPLVYWGFTGSTGALVNDQRFCTALTPQWGLATTQKRCVNEPVVFNNTTIAFAPIVKTYWDFGDGSSIDSVNASPTHTYTTPGDYTVQQRVLGADGCEETNTTTIRIGSKPIAGFSTADSCVTSMIAFTDTSRNAVGTINGWYWNLDNAGITSAAQNPSVTYSSYGIKNISLVVKTTEGCESDTLHKAIRIRSLPVAGFNFTDSVCLGTPTYFSQAVTTADGLPVNLQWQLAAGNSSTLPNPQIIFITPGNHAVTLQASLPGNSCVSTITKNVFVADKPVAAVRSAVICQSQQYQLQDSSYSNDGAITGWWWDLGNNQFSTLQNPAVTFTTNGPVTIRHAVRNARGCLSDTVTVTLNVSDKPLAKFGFDAPLCNSNMIQFHDSSTVSSGAVAQWSWLQAQTIFSTQQHPSGIFATGLNTVGLVATSSGGCISDTAYKTFTVKTTPVVSMNFNDACKFAAVNFTGAETSNIGITAWHWDFGDNTAGTGLTATHTYNNNGVYMVKLFGISAEGCSSAAVSSPINIYGTNAFAGNDTIAAAGQPVQLHASGGLSYLWTPGAGYLNANNIANPVAALTATQTFHLKAFTPEGCESFDDITVKIYKGPDIYLPNAFTPNGDGINDIFRGKPVGIKQFNYMRIFNRWGELIFYSTSPDKGWNGRFKGNEQSAGTYVAIISGIDFNGKLIEKKLSFLLIR